MPGGEAGGRMAPWLEQAWLQRYLERQLEGDEAAWFEAYAMDKPDLLERIEADTLLREAIARVQGDASRTAPLRARDVASNARAPAAVLPRLRRVSRQLPLLAAAASLVLGAGVGWLARTRTAPAPSALIASPTRIVFDTERGEAVAPRVEHADSASPYVLIEVPLPPGAGSATLEVAGSTSRELTPSADGFVSLLLARSVYAGATSVKLSYRFAGAERQRVLTFVQRSRQK